MDSRKNSLSLGDTKMKSYRFSDTYYCKECNMSHHCLSYMGKSHVKYADPRIKRRLFVDYGIYENMPIIEREITRNS